MEIIIWLWTYFINPFIKINIYNIWIYISRRFYFFQVLLCNCKTLTLVQLLFQYMPEEYWLQLNYKIKTFYSYIFIIYFNGGHHISADNLCK